MSVVLKTVVARISVTLPRTSLSVRVNRVIVYSLTKAHAKVCAILLIY